MGRTETPSITFKAKVETIYNMDDTVAYQRVKVPTLTRSRCDMAAFRKHPEFGMFANSDMFAGLLKRQIALAGIGEYIRLDQLPAAVTVDTSGFLARITIRVGE